MTLQNRALTLSLEREKQKVAKLQQALASGAAGAAGGAPFASKVGSWPGQQQQWTLAQAQLRAQLRCSA